MIEDPPKNLFHTAMLSARLAYAFQDLPECLALLGCAALEASSPEQHEQIADFVKKHGLRP